MIIYNFGMFLETQRRYSGHTHYLVRTSCHKIYFEGMELALPIICLLMWAYLCCFKFDLTTTPKFFTQWCRFLHFLGLVWMKMGPKLFRKNIFCSLESNFEINRSTFNVSIFFISIDFKLTSIWTWFYFKFNLNYLQSWIDVSSCKSGLLIDIKIRKI